SSANSVPPSIPHRLIPSTSPPCPFPRRGGGLLAARHPSLQPENPLSRIPHPIGRGPPEVERDGGPPARPPRPSQMSRAVRSRFRGRSPAGGPPPPPAAEPGRRPPAGRGGRPSLRRPSPRAKPVLTH